jgi:nicotinic acid mononucleotide adenylyltransferase
MTVDYDVLRNVIADSFYGSAIKHYKSTDFLEEAGFFDNGVPLNHNVERWDGNWLTTPLHKIIKNHSKGLNPTGKSAVLVTMGGFCPIHNGHIDMMNHAKRAVQSAGWDVIGGYISPSHDKYVLTKFVGVPMRIDHRIALCERAVESSDWLMVDPWEGRYNNVAINYTEVVHRLNCYLHKHLTFDVDVFCVFGGDNAGFAKAFVKKGFAVCVSRPDWESKSERIKNDIGDHPSILWTKGGSILSSREIRNVKSLDGLSTDVAEEMQKIGKPPTNKNYLIRNDREYAFQNWKCEDFDTKVLASCVISELDNSFEDVKAPDIATRMVVFEPKIAEQQKLLNAFSGNTINLDACTDSTIKIGISRQFELSDGQLRATRIIPRPGLPSVSEQIDEIPSGSYTLVDDDIATGYTMDRIEKMMPDRITIANRFTLLHVNSAEFHDIVDVKDFIVGSHGGGLVVTLPNDELARVPYMFPYVSLHARAKLQPTSQMAFSKRMWRHNQNFFKTNKITVKETDPYFQELARYIGFDNRTSMYDVCQYHIEQLDKL